MDYGSTGGTGRVGGKFGTNLRKNLIPMAALDLSSIPSHINTIERLFVWAGQALQSSANGLQVNVVANGGSAPLVQVYPAKTVDNVDRWIVSAYIPLNWEELNSPTEKTWMATKEVSNTVPGENLMTN
jgi:hypothetical protein